MGCFLSPLSNSPLTFLTTVLLIGWNIDLTEFKLRLLISSNGRNGTVKDHLLVDHLSNHIQRLTIIDVFEVDLSRVDPLLRSKDTVHNLKTVYQIPSILRLL